MKNTRSVYFDATTPTAHKVASVVDTEPRSTRVSRHEIDRLMGTVQAVCYRAKLRDLMERRSDEVDSLRWEVRNG